jgi:hypothetical protein
VEVFMLNGHPEAKTAYGWSLEGIGPSSPRLHAIYLHVPPIDSPESAVHAAMMASPFVSELGERLGE